MLTLASLDYRMDIIPERGGAVAGLQWRGMDILRPMAGASIFDTACFPLVPFSNRIADGRFVTDGRAVDIRPNFPGHEHPHPLHGFGWLSPWTVMSASTSRAVLAHCYEADEWPWPYRAEQQFTLSDTCAEITLSLRNDGAAAMPAGLGFHPYFPRDDKTFYHGLHLGAWQSAQDGLPLTFDRRACPTDWWKGLSVGTKTIDTIFTGREGALSIAWRSRNLALQLLPTNNLRCTVVYVPEDMPFFCVEPVSHMTDALNRGDAPFGPTWLQRGEELSVTLRFKASQIND